MNPRFQNQRVMLVAARDDQSKGRHGRERRFTEFAPVAGSDGNLLRKNLVVRQLRPVVENCGREVQLERQRGDGLRESAALDVESAQSG